MTATERRYELAHFDTISPVACPCGEARRAFTEVADYPATVHRTEISTEARKHYHRWLTETYYILECEPDASMELDDEVLPVSPGTCVLIRPGVRHRAVGRMTALIFVMPKFDPADEWFD
jgi:mannose-6-phosphate isomerase-like protein (cupin superfamily)